MDRASIEANLMSLVNIVDDLQKDIATLRQIVAAQAESIRLLVEEVAELREKGDE